MRVYSKKKSPIRMGYFDIVCHRVLKTNTKYILPCMCMCVYMCGCYSVRGYEKKASENS